jgi:U3 small nucleolar ribonucleoprotein protein IMP3
VTFIEQGRNFPILILDFRIGADTVLDPALLVTRSMEDHIKWTDSSNIKKKILNYKDKLDDYDMLE